MSSQDNKNEILLESGINEVEVMEFYLDGQSFGINVAKVRQLMQLDESMVTTLPAVPDEIIGTILFRGDPITFIDLNKALNRKGAEQEHERQLVLITEFNNKITGFLVHGVNRIHRVSWKALQPISYMPNKEFSSNFIGSITIDETEILVIDLERLVAKIDPEAGFAEYEPPHEKVHKANRHEVNLVFAEDSNYIRNLIVASLKKVGYTNVEVFKNGKEAFDYLLDQKHAETVEENVDLILTDIEMPQMDGLTLCKRVKQEVNNSVPVVIFSSLINDQMIMKCKEVGADSFLSKPQIKQLVEIIDEYCLEQASD